MFGKILYCRTRHLLHDLLELSLYHGDRVRPAFLAQSPHTVHEGSSHESELGPASKAQAMSGPSRIPLSIMTVIRLPNF